MRFYRLVFMLLALYFTFLGGSAYYGLVFPIRVMHHALVTLLLALWLYRQLRRGEGLPATPLNAPLYAAVGVWFVSALTSADPRMALEHLWFPLTHMLLFLALVDLLRRGRQRLVLEAQFMMGALVTLISALELASWYLGLGIIPGTDIGWVQVSPIPLEPPRLALAMNISTLLAGYVAPLVTLVAAWALTARQSFRLTLWLLAGALAAVLVLTLSRGGLLSATTGVGLLAVMRLAQTPRIARVIPTRVLVGFAAVAGVAVVVLLVVFYTSPARQSGDEGRLDMWRSAVAMTRDHPLLGVGPGLFGRAFRDYRDPLLARDKLAAAHNAYLNTAAETGLVGAAVSLWLGAAFLRAWWRSRNEAAGGRRLRLEAAFAALVGLGVHSFVDAFTITPIVLTTALLAAYCITPLPSSALAPLPAPSGRRERWAALAALGIVLAYGVAFIPLDIAQSHYHISLRGGENALSEAQTAANIDPTLRLYVLNVSYIQAAQTDHLDDAIAAYHHALALEPTWDMGLLNLAALKERQGDLPGAVAALRTAWDINALTAAPLHWARLSEQAGSASDDEIIAAYALYLRNRIPVALPLSGFWTETLLRRQAIQRVLPDFPVDVQYRILAVHDPERAAALVPQQPAAAAEFWVAGQHTLMIADDATAARSLFDEAIRRAPTEGDYYVTRAWAALSIDAAAAMRDADTAQLLGTRYEYPNLVRAELASTLEEAERLRASVKPPRIVSQEFAAVLYGRIANFDVLPEMRPID